MAILYDWTGRPIERRPDRLAASACAVIFDDAGRVLMMRRADNGWWGIPGGRSEIGETIAETAARETFEETGLRVAVKRLIGLYSDPADGCIAVYPNGDVIHFLNACFECEATGGELRGSEEGEELRYFAPDQLPDHTLLPHRIRIQDALARQASAFVR
jgi:8-oxo-dGTP pyrophosphatase MutT (NUDIX family)